jgi:hypothetical protein
VITGATDQAMQLVVHAHTVDLRVGVWTWRAGPEAVLLRARNRNKAMHGYCGVIVSLAHRLSQSSASEDSHPFPGIKLCQRRSDSGDEAWIYAAFRWKVTISVGTDFLVRMPSCTVSFSYE